ncbi:hypothetical protein J7I94_04990 [Streptomyces sp. ISL-12]|nr:hypothetical protein [Streptomyces sp. ISL-12]MBT2409916.1 hypothetical protein [Streptomyces sp. ISL-12]
MAVHRSAAALSGGCAERHAAAESRGCAPRADTFDVDLRDLRRVLVRPLR